MHKVFKIQSSGGVRNLVYSNHSIQGIERFLGVSRSQYKCHLKCHFLWISGPTKTAYPQKKKKKAAPAVHLRKCCIQMEESIRAISHLTFLNGI